jgi:hypothetical protein
MHMLLHHYCLSDSLGQLHYAACISALFRANCWWALDSNHGRGLAGLLPVRLTCGEGQLAGVLPRHCGQVVGLLLPLRLLRLPGSHHTRIMGLRHHAQPSTSQHSNSNSNSNSNMAHRWYAAVSRHDDGVAWWHPSIPRRMGMHAKVRCWTT